MTSEPRATTGRRKKREHGALLRLQRRLLWQIQRLRDELAAPSVASLVRQLRQSSGSRAAERTPAIKGAIEEAIRALQVWGAEIHDEMAAGEPENPTTNLVPQGLPPSLARFLRERQQTADCHIEVLHDPERGWVVHWKEYTFEGVLRGGGQFAERPYAWLEE